MVSAIDDIKADVRLTWGPQAIMFINIIEIRRNDRLSAAQ